MEKESDCVTSLTTASPNSRSLKTTVPISIVRLLKLRDKDKIKWNVKPENNRFLITIEPIEERYLVDER